MVSDNTLQINHEPWSGEVPTFPDVSMPSDGMMIVMRPEIDRPVLRFSQANAVNRPDHGILVAAGSDVSIPLGSEVLVPINGGVILSKFTWRDWSCEDQVRMFGPVYQLEFKTTRKPWYDYAMGFVSVGEGIGIRPIYSRLIVERVDMPEITASGLHVPLNACQRTTFCRILAKPDNSSAPQRILDLLSEVNVGDVWYYSAIGSERPLHWMLDEAKNQRRLAILEVEQLLCRLN